MPHRYVDPTSEEQVEFLFHLYFGGTSDKLQLAINRAHQDFSRTVHGIGAYPNARQQATKLIHNAIAELPQIQDTASQAVFDSWHKKATMDLCDAYSNAGYKTFFVGQAQKWINMTLKYVYVFGESRLPGYQAFYPYCHVPIDNIILAHKQFRGIRAFNCAWSRIDDYGQYLAFQEEVRRKFSHSSPLAVEFLSWQQRSAV